jgi:TetR/AcrR family transcriptional repressor of nem operon
VPRPKEFDPEQALDRAMHLFWCNGFEATSVGDLTEALGIGRASLYGTFGTKDALWLRALDRYRELETARGVACLTEGDGPARERIAAFLNAVAADALGDEANRGCLLVNAAMERGAHDEATAARVRAAMGALETAFRTVLEQGRARGELPAGADPAELARFLVAALNGVRTTAKATRDEATVRDAVAVTLRALG